MPSLNGLKPGIRFLDEHGINLVAILAVSDLPEDIQVVLRDASLEPERYANLVLMANGGARFWNALNDFGIQTDDPVDYFSHTLAQRFVDEFLGSPEARHIYPSSYPVPLQKLGVLAGWSHASVLGLSIHPRFGTWFAYRAAFLCAAELPPTTVAASVSPCASCAEKPCITACPVNAVREHAMLDLDACIGFRTRPESDCARRCLAREACPVGQEHRYSEEQISYHGGRSLRSVQNYLSTRSR